MCSSFAQRSVLRRGTRDEDATLWQTGGRPAHARYCAAHRSATARMFFFSVCMCLRSAAQNSAEKSVLPRPPPSFSRRDSASTALCFAGAVTSACSVSVGSTCRAVALFAPQCNGLARPSPLLRSLPRFLPTPAFDFPSLQPPSLSAHHRHVESSPPAPHEVDWKDARWYKKQTLCSATASSPSGSPVRYTTMCLVALDRPMWPALSSLRDRPVAAPPHRFTSSSTLKTKVRCACSRRLPSTTNINYPFAVDGFEPIGGAAAHTRRARVKWCAL